MMEKPDVDLIEGLSPSISIDQKTTSKNPEIDCGTVTEIYDYFRVLFARIEFYSPETGKEIKSMSVGEIVDEFFKMDESSNYLLLSRWLRIEKVNSKELVNLIKRGFVRFRIDDEIVTSENIPELKKTLDTI